MEDLDVISEHRNIAGECPLWDDENKKLYHVDIRGKKIYSLDWENGRSAEFPLPQQIGCIALVPDGSLLCAMEDGIYYLEDELNLTPAHQMISVAGVRFNDGKVGPDGKFYVGTLKRDGGGEFYSLKMGGDLKTLFGDVRISNGLDWSIDGRTLYYCDSSLRSIDSFEFEPYSGNLYERRTVFKVPESWGSPDGFSIDMEGNLWIALWGGHSVICLDPFSRKVRDKIELPVSKVSSCTFAGDNMDELIITTASLDCDLDIEPLAGKVFRKRVGVSGRKSFRFGEALK